MSGNQSSSNDQPETTSNMVDDKGGGNLKPKHIYINHLLADETEDIHAYLFPLSNFPNVQAAVEAAIPDIRAGRHRVSGSPDNVEWKYESYIVFILEDSDSQINFVKFCHEDTRENHTFDDEKRLNDFGDFTGVYYLNARRHRDGKPLGRRREVYDWCADHSHRKDSSKKPKAHENSGTNVGP